VEVTREMVEDAFRDDHAATTVLLAPHWLHTHPNDLGIILHYAEMAGHVPCLWTLHARGCAPLLGFPGMS